MNCDDRFIHKQKPGFIARIFYAFLNAIQNYFIRRKLDGKGL